MKRFIGITLLSFISCTTQYGGAMMSNVIETSNVKYSPNSGKVELYFESIQPKFSYTQIGFVTVEGGIHDNDNSVICELKYIAWKKGADAIINIKKNNAVKTERDLLNENKYDYSSITYTGVAIKCTDSSNTIQDVDSCIILKQKTMKNR